MDMQQWCIEQHRKTNHMYDTYLPYEIHLRMVNEVGNFLEYISPETKKLVYSGLHKSKLMPKLQHGHAFAMLARYAI